MAFLSTTIAGGADPYGFFPGVVGNYFSSPDGAGNRPVGNVDIILRIAPTTWIPQYSNTMFGKDDGSNSYAFDIGPSGELAFYYSTDGLRARMAKSSASNGGAALATGFSAGVAKWIRAKWTRSTDKVDFYTAPDGVAIPSVWTALGVQQSVVDWGFMAHPTIDSSTPGLQSGKMYRALMYSGFVDGGGSAVVDFNPSRYSSGSSFSAVTGETWTINAAGSSSPPPPSQQVLLNPLIKNYSESKHAPAAGASFAVNLDNGTYQILQTNANTTITLPDQPASDVKSFTLEIVYGGEHSITWAGGGTIKWAGGIEPIPSSMNGVRDIFSFTQNGTYTFGMVAGQRF